MGKANNSLEAVLGRSGNYPGRSTGKRKSGLPSPPSGWTPEQTTFAQSVVDSLRRLRDGDDENQALTKDELFGDDIIGVIVAACKQAIVIPDPAVVEAGPTIKRIVEADEITTVETYRQYLIHQELIVDGELVIEDAGELAIL
ncbi:hypothetical protein [Desulfovibrio inopinatus]|uniref:hypothetical protein n=1 Tax=Desulfovibrio inopinatus TaxID=102109 RepID=UPI0003FD05AD|nr:hypothetical protein [Desulfovibrio inopinatus]